MAVVHVWAVPGQRLRSQVCRRRAYLGQTAGRRGDLRSGVPDVGMDAGHDSAAGRGVDAAGLSVPHPDRDFRTTGGRQSRDRQGRHRCASRRTFDHGIAGAAPAVHDQRLGDRSGSRHWHGSGYRTYLGLSRNGGPDFSRRAGVRDLFLGHRGRRRRCTLCAVRICAGGARPAARELYAGSVCPQVRHRKFRARACRGGDRSRAAGAALRGWQADGARPR